MMRYGQTTDCYVSIEGQCHLSLAQGHLHIEIKTGFLLIATPIGTAGASVSLQQYHV